MAPEAAPLRVLMVLESGYPVRGGGGAESQLRTLARELRRRGAIRRHGSEWYVAADELDTLLAPPSARSHASCAGAASA